MPLGGATFGENSGPLGQKGGLQGGFGAVTDNLVRVVDPETHPGASRTPPTEGIFTGVHLFKMFSA